MANNGGQALVATIQMPLPARLDSIAPTLRAEHWPKWLNRFERYRIASQLHTKTNHEQVSTMLYSMGDCADDILSTLCIDETRATYDEVKQAFEDHFKSRRNVMVERARFNKRVQQKGEPVDTFIQHLYKMAEYCNYGTLKEELIRDRIVVGVHDDRLSDKLQAKADLTLQEAVKMTRQYEELLKNKSVVRSDHNASGHAPKQVDQVKTKSSSSRNSKRQPTSKHSNSPSTQQSTSSSCKWCGLQSHPRRLCPAKNATCSKCKKKGHYAAVCLSGKQVHELVSSQTHDANNYYSHTDGMNNYYDHHMEHTENSDLFLGQVGSGNSSWTATIKINGNDTKVKLDTGADVTVLGLDTPWLPTQPTTPSRQALNGPGSTPLEVIATFPAELAFRGRKSQEIVYLIRNHKGSLLSRTACERLGLLKPAPGVNLISKDSVSSEFPELFRGLGKMKTTCTIRTKQDAVPHCVPTPRRVAQPLLPKIKDQLQEMQRLRVITAVTEPTEWCAGMVPVVKSDGSVRICVDLTELNKNVQRELHTMSTVDESLAKLGQSKVYSKLDANSGFWQLPLEENSKKLTTFITPFGRFYFERLPFGISSAPEIFQRTMSDILKDCDGVICHMDDILVHAETQEVHDSRLRKVLNTLLEAGVTLNNKCEFSKSRIRFLGHIIDGGSLHPDPRKLEAIEKFPTPTCVTDLQRFNGMVNQLGKFVPNLATINAPLRDLLRKDNAWLWGPQQDKSFSDIKKALLSSPVLTAYDPSLPTIIASDASSLGLGAVLLQIHKDNVRHPVAFASRSLTNAEKNYAVIEKEALGITWACDRFSDYVFGLKFTVETDHKPLVPLLSTTDLSKLPTRILRFRLRLMRYSPSIVYVHGQNNCTADALSRAPVSEPEPNDFTLAAEVHALQQVTRASFPATDTRLQQIYAAQLEDPTLKIVRQYCRDGWPQTCPEDLKPFQEHRAHITLLDDLLVKDDRIIIPTELRHDILTKLHGSHLGITKCRNRAQSTVWWPGLSSEIAEMVNRCYECQKTRPTPVEPLQPTEFPSYPWERIASDLFELEGHTYLLVVDYYSRWPEIRKLNGLTSEHVIGALKGIFAVHGIPKTLVSDNGPQYASHLFTEFSELCNF